MKNALNTHTINRGVILNTVTIENIILFPTEYSEPFSLTWDSRGVTKYRSVLVKPIWPNLHSCDTIKEDSFFLLRGGNLVFMRSEQVSPLVSNFRTH